MGDNAIENIDDLLKRATKEYKILNKRNLEYLDKLGVSPDDLDVEAREILKTAVEYQLKTGIDELSENKFKIWYAQNCLNNSMLKADIMNLKFENQNVLKQINKETELCNTMLRNVKEMEIVIDENCRESDTKRLFKKNEETLYQFNEKLKSVNLKLDPKLDIHHIESRIKELNSLRKKLEEETKKAENKKCLEMCLKLKNNA
ncbi:uncharacterized protein LOC113367871 [Ctenocephalides felis]|uniref:uncharacterized protein LOC113367871 n=1 Tax=Ctenocephalides felis TaxID=7515 RepID=UPI000E6E12AE|nr:uncharacterized protein LOC113367871 [Ctenocephalides felis]